MTIEEIRKCSIKRATHYRLMKSFNGKVKVLYYQVIGNIYLQLVSDSIHVVCTKGDAGELIELWG